METKFKSEYYAQKYKEGLYFQDFVVEELYKIGLPIISYASKEFQFNVGENKAGLEIKNDNRYKETGNIFIEVAEKSHEDNPFYVPSGIYRNDNTWLYLIGDQDLIFVFSKKQLRYLHEKDKFKTIEIKRKTAKGFLVPREKAENFYAIKIIKPQSFLVGGEQ